MSLFETLQRRGYTFRQHLEEAGWTRRKLTVVDLDETQRSALERGGVPALRQALEAQGLWSFPAMDIEVPLPVRPDIILSRGGVPSATVVAPGPLHSAAQELVDAIYERSGLRLPLSDGDRTDLNLLQSQHVILFGGAHESRFAMDMALRYQTGFVDATVPGDGGWVVTTHVGLDASGCNVTQISASPSRRKDAMACALERLATEGDTVVLRHIHRIEHGMDMRERFPSWETVAAGLPRRVPRLQGQPVTSPQDLSALADLLAQGLDSGGPDVNLYNAAPIDIAVGCAQYYQRSADPRALKLFYELLFRLADYYLKTPEGASYPADLDFRIGHLVLYYSRLEHEPIFSDDDRLILPNLLLSCIRSACEYARTFWPVEPGGPTRHNHETFPARSLMFAADYFRRYDIPDTGDWLTYTDAVFDSGLWTRYKQRENANHYETCVFDHGASYSAFTGRSLGLFDPECLRQAAMRHVVTTDNFLRPVDYGDSQAAMSPGKADRLAVIYASQYDDPTIRWFAQACFARQRDYLPSALDCFTDVRRPYSGSEPQTHVWENLPLDPKFTAEFCPDFPPEHAFDKLAFRTGWGEDDHYLLFEGVGNQTVSHSHNELNGIVRLNHLGRHWVVSNGYGRLAGMTNVARSFSTRIRGPEDHNMLVLRRDGDSVRDLPACNALLQQGQVGDLAFATGALLHYGGTNWFRTLLILANQFVLVIDRVCVTAAGLESGHIEWNCLGKPASRDGGFLLEQQGVFMHITSRSGWASQQGTADRSADWQSVLKSGAYPYATFPLTKLIFQMPGVEDGLTFTLSTLLAASRSSEISYQIQEPSSGRVRIDSPDGGLPELHVDNQDLSVRSAATSLEVSFSPDLQIPDALAAWEANRQIGK